MIHHLYLQFINSCLFPSDAETQNLHTQHRFQHGVVGSEALILQLNSNKRVCF